MSKSKHVVLDSHTFDLLTELTEDARVTKATYLRQLIREDAMRRGKASIIPLGIDINAGVTNPSLLQAITGKSDFRVAMERDGKIEVVPFKDMNLAKRVLTQQAVVRGETINTKKQIAALRAALELLVADLEGIKETES